MDKFIVILVNMISRFCRDLRARFNDFRLPSVHNDAKVRILRQRLRLNLIYLPFNIHFSCFGLDNFGFAW